MGFAVITCIDYNSSRTDYTDIELLNNRWHLEIPDADQNLISESETSGFNGDGLYYQAYGFDEKDSAYFEQWDNCLPDTEYREMIDDVCDQLGVEVSMPMDGDSRYFCSTREDGSMVVMCYSGMKLYVAELIV